MRSATLALCILLTTTGCTSRSVVLNNSADFSERVKAVAYAEPPAKKMQLTLKDDRKEVGETFKFNDASIVLYGEEEREIPYEQIESVTVIKKSKSSKNAVTVIGTIVLAPVFVVGFILFSPMAIYEAFSNRRN